MATSAPSSTFRSRVAIPHRIICRPRRRSGSTCASRGSARTGRTSGRRGSAPHAGPERRRRNDDAYPSENPCDRLWALGGPVLAANPYAPALTVNDSVITHYDIDQRVKLLDALGANGDINKLAIQQLTEDRLKLQAAKRAQDRAARRRHRRRHRGIRHQPRPEDSRTSTTCSMRGGSTSRRWTTSSNPASSGARWSGRASGPAPRRPRPTSTRRWRSRRRTRPR